MNRIYLMGMSINLSKLYKLMSCIVCITIQTIQLYNYTILYSYIVCYTYSCIVCITILYNCITIQLKSNV